MDLDLDIDRFVTVDVAATLILVASLVLVRAIAGHAIRSRTDAAPQSQRRWTATVRNALFFVGLLGIVLIWAPQLRTFALSLTAVAVAIVVATKELILCLSGAFLRASSRSFSVGDWIEVGGIRGEVVDHTVLATTLQEFQSEPHSFVPTGQTVVVPNSLFLMSPVRNQTALRDHVYHRFAVTLEPVFAAFRARPAIEEVVQARFAPFRERAVRANVSIERHTGSDLPDPAPLIRFGTTDLGKCRIEITLFCPPDSADALEDEITSDIVARVREEADRTEGQAIAEQAGGVG